MKNFIWIAILLIILQSSCTSEKEKVPARLLSQEKMQAVLVDALIAESYMQQNRLTTDSAKKETVRLYAQILSRHKIDKKEFYESFAYYTRHPDLMQESLQPVIDSLSSIEAGLK